MEYGPKDLGVFNGIHYKERLEGTSYFELHPGELPEPLACWLPGSLFIKDAAFDLLVTCVEHANPKFDYFGFERFDSQQVEALVEELSMFVSELVPGCNRDVVFSRYNSLFKHSI